MTTPHLRQVCYTATITASTLAHFDQRIRVWDTPRSIVEGAQVVYEITTPTRVDVVAEQLEPFSDVAERAHIHYQGQEGWVLMILLTRTV